jgi:hypothetical protein
MNEEKEVSVCVVYSGYIALVATNYDSNKLETLNQYLLRLMWKEIGVHSIDDGSQSDYLLQVRFDMTVATRLGFEKDFDPHVYSNLKEYLYRIKTAQHSNELLAICRDGIELLGKPG